MSGRLFCNTGLTKFPYHSPTSTVARRIPKTTDEISYLGD